MHDIALGGQQVALPLPEVVWDVIAPNAQIKRFLRQPEVRENIIMLVLIGRREHQHESRNIRRRGKVEPAVADTTFEQRFIKIHLAGVPLVHRHPAYRLLYPLVQAELPEGVLLAGILLCRFAGGFNLVHADGFAEGRVRFLPDFRRCPVGIVRSAVDNRIEGLVDFPSFEDVLRLLVYLVADRIGVRACRRDQEIQRLHSCVARALRHNVKELPVWLRMKFIEHDTVDVEAVLAVCLGGKHLIK